MTPAEKITFEAVRLVGAEFPPDALPTAALNVKRCIVEATAAAARADEEGLSAGERRRRAAAAYKLHLPVMDDKASVHAYIACIAEGISLNFINGNDGSKLLYAAQVALSMLRAETTAKVASIKARNAARRKPARRAA